MGVIKYIAWRNWAVLEYNACTENIFVFFYLALTGGSRGSSFLISFFVFYFLSAFATSYGYLVNDLGDRELDRRHGKPNVFSGDSGVRAVTVVLACLSGAFLLSFYFRHNRTFVILWLLWITIATFYSLPPFRFKERGKTGLVIIVAAQRLIPALLIFSVFGKIPAWDAILIIIYITNRGFISDVRHQLEDFGKDSSTGTRTFAVENSGRAESLFRILLLSDLLLQGLIHLACLWKLPAISIGNVPVPVSLPVFIAFTCGVLLVMLRPGRKTPKDPYHDRGAFNFVHLGLPSFYFPLSLLFLRAAKEPVH